MEYRRGWRSFIRSSATVNLRQVDRRVLARIWSYVRPHRGQMVLVVLAVLLQALLGAVPPLLYRYFIDVVVPTGDMRRLLTLTGLLLVLPFLSVSIGLVQQAFATRLGETLVQDLRNAMYAHVQRLSLRFFTDTRAGEIVARFTGDVEDARRMVTGSLPTVLTASITLVSTLSIMTVLEWRLTVPGVLLFPLLWPFAYWLAKILRRTHHQGRAYNAQLSSMVNETLSVNGAVLMKLFGQEKNAGTRFRTLSAQVSHFRTRWAIMSYWLTSGMGILSGLGTALFYGLGGWLVLRGDLTLGTIVAFVAYLPRVYQPISALSHVNTDLIQGIVSFERVFEYMDMPIEIRDAADAVALKQPVGRLEFENVSFHYAHGTAGNDSLRQPAPDDATPPLWAVQDISFTVQPGQMVALVGLSGAGKSTLINLVMRLYDPIQGRILLDGRDLRSLTLESLSACIGMVTQDAYLFHDTLRANLLYARPDASQAELERACAAAQIHDFIQSLPQGYDTVVGERGYRLSGGEKQRVSIARVLLKDPVILILDEATSHLDSQSESRIQHVLEPLFKRCTSLVIAHRLSTVHNADAILVLDRGQMVEWGSHDELLARQGLYSHLHALQFRIRSQVGRESM